MASHNTIKIEEIKYCFHIINASTANIDYTDETYLDKAIDEFRFYCGHITVFYHQGHIIRTFPQNKEIILPLDKIQVSQFYINKKKLQELEADIQQLDDIRIPVIYLENQYVSVDGHTRLKLLERHHIKEAICYFDTVFDSIQDFVQMAKNRKLFSIYDLPVISDEDYKTLWHQFCDDYFKNI